MPEKTTRFHRASQPIGFSGLRFAAAFLVPLLLSGALLVTQDACVPVEPKCQGKTVTMTVDVNDGSTVYGTSVDDVIRILDGPVTVLAGDGNDTVCVLADLSFVDGGPGDDLIVGGPGPDILLGREGVDNLQGGDGIDYLLGGAGNDFVVGGAGDDAIYGDEGDDLVAGGEGHDYIDGGEGADDLLGGAGSDRIWGGPGDDLVDGEDGDDLLYGEVGNDELHGADGDDEIYGGDGDDELFGDAGWNQLFGGYGDDDLYAGEGGVLRGEEDDDLLVGSPINDLLYGGPGIDNLQGGGGDDYLLGGSGGDYVLGGPGDDIVWGQAGDDILLAEDGNDLIFGSAGSDYAFGGPGADRFDAAGHVEQVFDGEAGEDSATLCSGMQTTSIESVSYDDPSCPIESSPIALARLEVWVGNCDGSADPAQAKIQPYRVSLHDDADEEFFLADRTSQPQFKVGTRHVHDFLMGSATVSDIRRIKIRNEHGNDDSCLNRIRLGVNHFTEGTWTRRWLYDSGTKAHYIGSPGSGNETLTISFDELRADDDWAPNNVDSLESLAFTGIDYATLTRLIEQLVLAGIVRANREDAKFRKRDVRPHHTPEWVDLCADDYCPDPTPIGPPNDSQIARAWVIFSADLVGKDWFSATFDLGMSCTTVLGRPQVTIAATNIDANHDGVFNVREVLIQRQLNKLSATFSEDFFLDGDFTCQDLDPQFDECAFLPFPLAIPRPGGCY